MSDHSIDDDHDAFLRAAARAPRLDDVVLEDSIVGGHYRVDRKVGRGGMGVVHRAHDLVLERDVALKVLPPATAGDAKACERLLAEARIAAGLSHPNIVTVHEAGLDGERVYLAMELLSGRTLREVLRERPSRAEALRIARGVAEAIAHAHARGVIHRDLKPENVIVDAASVKVLDFGIARVVSASTSSNGVLGTPGYMSPEQLEGRPLGAASDVFAFGAILHELLTGRRAFPGELPIDQLIANARATPEGADPLVAACLSRDPARRPAMREVLDRLEPRAARFPWVALTLLPLLALPWAMRTPTVVSAPAPSAVDPPKTRLVTGIVSVAPLVSSAPVVVAPSVAPRPAPSPKPAILRTPRGGTCARSAECASGFCVAERCQ